jgi:hypothetical protein
MRIRRKRDIEEAELPKARRVRWYFFTAIFALLALSLMILPYQQWFAERYIARTAVSTSITWIVLQTAGLAVFLILALYGTGRIRLERAAYRADQLDIQDFLDAKGEKMPDVTAVFKRILNESKLYTPTAVPGVGTSYDFIQIVENAGEAMDSWWKAASRLVKLVRPPSAFRVSGTVRFDEVTGKHRLILELVRAPRFAASPMVIEDETLPRVLERAANAVAALVMPRSKFCGNIYWAPWLNAKIPAELFDAYQRANQFTLERRYDEALAEYYRAIEQDPTNVYIRLEIGALQEQLDLLLDALATYDDVITLCSRGTPRLAKWWIGPDFTRQRRGLTARHANALLVARYRHALVLGQGDRIAASWWIRKPTCENRPEFDARSVQRANLRAALHHRFQRYARLDIRTVDRWISRAERQTLHRELLAFPVEELSTTPLDPEDPVYQRKRTEYADRSRRLRAYLAALSQFEIERLIDDYHPYRTIRLRRARNLSRTVSVGALRLTLVWSVLRRAMADADVHGGRVPVHQLADPHPGRKSRLGKLFPTGKWPMDVNNLVAAVKATRSRWRRTPYWNESYNAACVYAVGLLPVDPLIAVQLPVQAADDLAKHAVGELYRATTTSHSSHLASRRTWVLAEDPDLASLRGRAHFRNFEIVTFSPARPATLRPRKVHVWEQVTYLSLLISEIGRCRSKYWHDRVSAPDVADEDESETNRSERDAWRLVSRLVAGHQDWFTRYEAVTAFRGWAAEFGYDGVVEGFPLYSESSLVRKYAGLLTGKPEEGNDRPSGIDQINHRTQRYIKECDRRMESAVVALRNLVEAGEDKVTADDRSHRWAALADWFDDSSARKPATERESHFRELVASEGGR